MWATVNCLTFAQPVYCATSNRKNKIKQVFSLAVLLFVFFVQFGSMPAFGLPFVGPVYKVKLSVRGDQQLQKNLNEFVSEQQAQNLQLKAVADLPKSEQALSRYSRLLNGILQEKLQALGYYSAQIAASENIDQITYQIKPGKRSIIRAIDLQMPEFLDDAVQSKLLQVLLSEKLQLGEPLVAQHVIAAQDRLKRYIDQNYCFVNPKLEQQVAIVRASKSAEVVFVLETKPEQTIESVEFVGAASLSHEFLQNVINLKPGCYKSRQVARAQVDLLQTGLLSTATPRVQQLPDNKVKLIFQLQERKHKTQRVGFGFASDEGARFTLGWENRNWRGNGKNLSAELLLSQLTTQVQSELRVPQFKLPKLSFLWQAELVETQVDAFDSKSASVSGILEFQANRHWLFSTGLTSRYSKVESSTGDDINRLISIPTSVQWDRSDSLLDPTRGFTWTAGVEPFTDLAKSNSNFLQFVTGIKQYYSPQWAQGDTGIKHVTFATRFVTGSLVGAELADVPADLRFYTGGGGSVRGFDFQALSPQVRESIGFSSADPNVDPDEIIGGRSFIEAALEMRLRFSAQWGAGVFVDAGRGFVDQTPDFGAPLAIGAGFGLRYITSFAPIRMDLAWPVDSFNSLDSGVQLYVGLKQAF